MAVNLFKEIMADSKTNFMLLFKRRQETITVIDQNGREQVITAPARRQENPFHILQTVEVKQWLFFLCAFLALLADMMDFFVMVIQGKQLSVYFKSSIEEVSKAMTFTMLMRPFGAIIFGVLGDYMGRKYPMVISLFLLGLLQICSIFCKTLTPFLAVRALFGIPMGGIYGCAAAMAMDGCSTQARGLMSGLLGSAGAFSYVLASCIVLAFGPGIESWRKTFWVSAGISFLAGIIRLAAPESNRPKGIQSVIQPPPLRGSARVKQFLQEFKLAMKTSWKRFVYSIVLVTLVLCLALVSFNSYATFTMVSRGMDVKSASKLGIVTKMGGFIGTIVISAASQYAGRRRMMLLCCLFALILNPALILPTSFGGLAAGGFFFDFFVDGLFGLLPVHLNELAPPSFRALLPGLAFQLGSFLSAGSAQLVNALAESHHTTYKGKTVEAYGPVMMILIAIIAFQLAQHIAVGPENHGGSFEKNEQGLALLRQEQYNSTPMITFPSSRVQTFGSEYTVNDDDKLG